MVAMMAVEVFVQLYVLSFVLSAIIAVWLLVAAARRLGRRDRDNADRFDQGGTDEV